ncbi:D-alanyl-D-alanine carboxypeptidase/D-alanyl-D-alanine-endopeptidase [Arthrobacter sp. PAMC25284]|uniref:D-alanyl-D-alanine carboxypeptidase/D-alanyl-D-alanine endopeptidase n=1 Tax=Arthrobacter sp. PAMC25284 TaxID=2861279 RepID=UPI001C63229A|nr:D-alanyl-D-alanine carboxypeptidase/D-alanyl-D-alanine-endopeptidase [Arthrobacter sp. PAMC25284]QYF88775.1 D-alanyl-D-alanine carboxypeptidase/D-alanyl-D-alanine-endopeptidase [Arthrobacter sp. PAMC25284]
MKRRARRTGADPTSGLLRGYLPLVLPVLIIAALAFPAGIALAPALRGTDRTPDAVTAVPWQQLPTALASPGSATHGLAGRLSGDAPLPDAGPLTALLNGTLQADGGGSITGIVQDAATGQVVFDRAGDEARIPASNMKIFTAGAALRTLGPERRFGTSVAAGPTPGSVVLTGGGDVLLGAGESAPGAVLGRAGLATLARSTVRALQSDGVTGELTVLLDDSLFTGPPLSAAWSPDDVAAGEIAPLYPLALNSARFDPARLTGPRPQDPAMAAAESFAGRLAAEAAAAPDAGLSVAPGVVRSPGAGPNPDPGARVLAEVQSATVGQQVELLLRTSDNYLAEAIGRMTALAAGKPGSNDGAIAALLAQLADLGIPTDTLHAADVSGLALANRVSARQLAGMVRTMTSGEDARLRAALPGFPVAALTGTLGERFRGGNTAAGAGLVRAKTGTLNTVSALSGYVVDADGRLLVFAFIGNGLSPGADNKPVLDRSAAVLARCGCR